MVRSAQLESSLHRRRRRRRRSDASQIQLPPLGVVARALVGEEVRQLDRRPRPTLVERSRCVEGGGLVVVEEEEEVTQG